MSTPPPGPSDAELAAAAAARPVSPPAVIAWGERLGDAGAFHQAQAVFEAALAAAPQALVLRVGLGFLALKRLDAAAARTAFEAVRAADPGRPDAMIGLARARAMAGDNAEAADLYRRVLADRPDDAASRIALGRC